MKAFCIIIFFFSLIFFLLISCLKIYNNKFSHALLFWIIHVHHNYYFRRKQHSYAACDAALAASIYILMYFYVIKWLCYVVEIFLTKLLAVILLSYYLIQSEIHLFFACFGNRFAYDLLCFLNSLLPSPRWWARSHIVLEYNNENMRFVAFS